MNKLKLLIVEDDESLLNLYDAAVSDSLFEKRLVADGRSAMENYRTWHPDIILLDIFLPGMSGRSILKEIRDEAGDMETTIIISTSTDDKNDIKTCKDLGIQGYIVKPFDYKTLDDEILKCYRDFSNKTGSGR
ncbi:MAG: response regulator [Proteobacteria bacterium]|nr:response regulator [Pseudomonadota bacterium]